MEVGCSVLAADVFDVSLIGSGRNRAKLCSSYRTRPVARACDTEADESGTALHGQAATIKLI